jgi:hypothetical protein
LSLALPAAAAKFTATTSNGPNSFASGTVVLTDNSNTALFALPTIITTSVRTSCVEVTYSGTATPTVKVYGAVSGDGGATSVLTFKIEESAVNGTCASFATQSTLFTNTLNNFSATNFSNGVATNLTTGKRAYRFSLNVVNGTAITFQGLDASLSITWEARAGT